MTKSDLKRFNRLTNDWGTEGNLLYREMWEVFRLMLMLRKEVNCHSVSVLGGFQGAEIADVLHRLFGALARLMIEGGKEWPLFVAGGNKAFIVQSSSSSQIAASTYALVVHVTPCELPPVHASHK
ncbi:hypothetical protein OPV22_027821 [Ensete ventricosum]|uniref:Uncharacterized protein n=1 Tax=Ensete ventricosum TaxID=4639 RepID=A0AAV8Q193_ENSVE|nr:hypothetical protein OPV22_027821 [Ensete ventricosum]